MINTSPTPAHAAGGDDGRINRLPWVNSWGAVAVYCIDGTGLPASVFTGGGIQVLDATGNLLLFAHEAAITAAQAAVATKNTWVLITSTSTKYSLYALPNNYFQLNSIPDSEGKTFIGTWQNCTPVGPLQSTSSTALCSINSLQSINITFVNNTASAVKIWWVDFPSMGCGEIYYNTLNAGQSYVQQSYVTHPWRIRNAATGALLKEIVFNAPGNYIVTVP